MSLCKNIPVASPCFPRKFGGTEISGFCSFASCFSSATLGSCSFWLQSLPLPLLVPYRPHNLLILNSIIIPFSGKPHTMRQLQIKVSYMNSCVFVRFCVGFFLGFCAIQGTSDWTTYILSFHFVVRIAAFIFQYVDKKLLIQIWSNWVVLEIPFHIAN